MFSRREFVQSLISSALFKDPEPKKPPAIAVTLIARDYSANMMKATLLNWSNCFSSVSNLRNYRIELCALYQDVIVAKESFWAIYCKGLDRWDLWPDPGHVKGKQCHMVNWACIRFHDKFVRFEKKNPNLNWGEFKVEIRLMEKQ